MFTRTIRGVAATLRLMGTPAMVLAGLHCGDGREPTVRELEQPRVVPLSSCQGGDLSVETRLEVVPGLELLGVSGLPEEPSSTPQPRLCFHWRATDALASVSDVEVEVRAENRLASVRAGFYRLTKVLPHPLLWEKDVCFAASCALTLPIAREPTEWTLGCRVSAAGVPSQEVELGSVVVQ